MSLTNIENVKHVNTQTDDPMHPHPQPHNTSKSINDVQKNSDNRFESQPKTDSLLHWRDFLVPVSEGYQPMTQPDNYISQPGTAQIMLPDSSK